MQQHHAAPTISVLCRLADFYALKNAMLVFKCMAYARCSKGRRRSSWKIRHRSLVPEFDISKSFRVRVCNIILCFAIILGPQPNPADAYLTRQTHPAYLHVTRHDLAQHHRDDSSSLVLASVVTTEGLVPTRLVCTGHGFLGKKPNQHHGLVVARRLLTHVMQRAFLSFSSAHEKG
ncbi:hypothetical protein BGX38DRAFT_449085 [Terfezia claveryi]|nr:hypothetical protein BGX38DRAFT_449085 [Terfezia claveryi]